MRFLHVLSEKNFSGGEAQLEHLLRHLQAVGHENSLVLVPDAKFGRVAEELNLPVRWVNMRRPLYPSTALGLRRAIREIEPEILHFCCGRSLLWGGLFSLGMPIPLRVTTRRIDYPIGSWIHRGGRYRRLVDHVIVNCKSVQNRVLEAGVPKERVTMVHEGIDVEPWNQILSEREQARMRLGLSPDALVISCAATLRPRKGQEVLIQAFTELADSYPRAVLFLAGSGSDLGNLRRRVIALGLEGRIRVPGAIKKISDLVAASDIAVMPSFNEGLSNACLEASAAGLPLVVSDVGGLPEIVCNGVSGTVVPAGDVGSLRDALARYLADDSLRRRAGAAGAERTRSMFRVERMTVDMENLFQDLLRKEPRRVAAG